ncbi:MAG TPA: hypothetical protein VFP79_14810 [Pseudolabrys sp.]|nr:hypothetical protein [Pseudolabrys sp.]
MQRRHRTAANRHVRVSNDRLGMLLDHGSASAYAIHGPTWAISEGQVAKPAAEGGIGMGERKLRKGLV